MIDEDILLTKKLTELSERACTRGFRQYSGFLSLSEQDILYKLKLRSKVILIGGFDTAER